MSEVLRIAAIFIVLMGLFFFTTGTIGLLRFPDFYTRMHATGKSDTLGALLCLTGMALYNGFSLISIKIIFIAIFILLTSPTATHSMARAAWNCGVTPWSEEKEGERIEE